MQINRRDFLKTVSSFAVAPALPMMLTDQIRIPLICIVTAYDNRDESYMQDPLTYVSNLSKSRLIKTPDIHGVNLYVKAKDLKRGIRTAVAITREDNKILDMSEMFVEFDDHDMHLMTAGDYSFLVEFRKA